MEATNRIALVAHDERKADMLARVDGNNAVITQHQLFATGTTGRLVTEEGGLAVTCMKSGPLGGDQGL